MRFREKKALAVYGMRYTMALRGIKDNYHGPVKIAIMLCSITGYRFRQIRGLFIPGKLELSPLYV